jgi:hypothetical protein
VKIGPGALNQKDNGITHAGYSRPGAIRDPVLQYSTNTNILSLTLAIFVFPYMERGSLRWWKINRQFGGIEDVNIGPLASVLKQGLKTGFHQTFKGCHSVRLHHNRLRKVHERIVQK